MYRIKHYYKGAIFETYVISEIMKYVYNAGEKCGFYYWRDNHRKEVDLILESGRTIKIVEMKSGKTIHPEYFQNLNYWLALSNTPATQAYLVFSGEKSMQRADKKILGWREIYKIVDPGY